MKPAIYLVIAIGIFFLGYNYAWQKSQQACQAIQAEYQELYEQAIQNQIIDYSDILHISPNIKLKEKSNEQN